MNALLLLIYLLIRLTLSSRLSFNLWVNRTFLRMLDLSTVSVYLTFLLMKTLCFLCFLVLQLGLSLLLLDVGCVRKWASTERPIDRYRSISF